LESTWINNSTLEIKLKIDSISTILKSTQIELSRFSILKIKIKLNCQEIENHIIMSKITILDLSYYNFEILTKV